MKSLVLTLIALGLMEWYIGREQLPESVRRARDDEYT
jgi:hypothetical protein